MYGRQPKKLQSNRGITRQPQPIYFSSYGIHSPIYNPTVYVQALVSTYIALSNRLSQNPARIEGLGFKLGRERKEEENEQRFYFHFRFIFPFLSLFCNDANLNSYVSVSLYSSLWILIACVCV